jgi:hypothetical protein
MYSGVPGSLTPNKTKVVRVALTGGPCAGVARARVGARVRARVRVRVGARVGARAREARA